MDSKRIQMFNDFMDNVSNFDLISYKQLINQKKELEKEVSDLKEINDVFNSKSNDLFKVNNELERMFNNMKMSFLSNDNEIRVELNNRISENRDIKKRLEDKYLAVLSKNLRANADKKYDQIDEKIINKIANNISMVDDEYKELLKLNERYENLCLFIDEVSYEDYIDYVDKFDSRFFVDNSNDMSVEEIVETIDNNKTDDTDDAVQDIFDVVLGVNESETVSDKENFDNDKSIVEENDSVNSEIDLLSNENKGSSNGADDIDVTDESGELFEDLDEDEEYLYEPDRSRWEIFKDFVHRHKTKIIVGILGIAIAFGAFKVADNHLNNKHIKSELIPGNDIDNEMKFGYNTKEGLIDLTVEDEDYTLSVDGDSFVNSNDYNADNLGKQSSDRLVSEYEIKVDGVENYGRIGDKVYIAENTAIYSNINDVYNNSNSLPAYFGAGMRTIIGTSVEYGGEIYTVYITDNNSNDIINYYINNGGTIVGYLTTVKDASEIKSMDDVVKSAEGFYSADSINFGRGYSK